MECPFPIWAIFITVSKELPSSIRQWTYREPFGKWKVIMNVKDDVEALNAPEKEIWTAALTTQAITQWEEGSSVNVVTSTVNYQPSITAYIRKRVKTDSWTYNAFNIKDETEDENIALYGKNVIIDKDTFMAQKPNPYKPTAK